MIAENVTNAMNKYLRIHSCNIISKLTITTTTNVMNHDKCRSSKVALEMVCSLCCGIDSFRRFITSWVVCRTRWGQAHAASVLSHFMWARWSPISVFAFLCDKFGNSDRQRNRHQQNTSTHKLKLIPYSHAAFIFYTQFNHYHLLLIWLNIVLFSICNVPR